MSTVEEDSDTVTVETVNSVTLTRDTDGNLILHCPQNGREQADIIVNNVIFNLSHPDRQFRLGQ